MKISITLTFFILGTFGFPHLFAQDSKIIFEHFELEQGINANIPCGFQDRTGYLWFGSLHGVFRYDGYSFKPFVTFNGDSSDLTDAEVKAICDDSDGNIWIGHIQGLDKLNPTTEEVRHYKLNPEKPLTDLSNHVLALCFDRNGNLWIGTGNGLYLFNKSTETFKRMLHDSTDSKSIIDNSINDIYEDKIGNLWFGTDGGLDKLDKTGNKFIHSWNYQIGSSDMGWGSFWIHSIFEDSDGTIWLGTSGGVVEFNRKAESFTLYKNIPNNPESLSNNWVNTICEDLNGNLWLGTDGIDIFNKRFKKFSNYKYDEKDPGSISSNNAAAILLDRSGTIWITTYGGGVNKHILPNQNIKEYVTADYGEITNTGWGNLVEDNNGKIWIGRDKGLISFDPEKETFKEEPLKVYISGILLDKEGTLWINSRAAWNLYYKKNNEKQIRQFFYSNGEAFSEGVSCMYNCRDGSIWIGTIDGKILKLNQHRKVIEQIAKYDNSISVIYEDKTGLLWIGTDGEGVICYDPGKKTFTRFYSDPKDAMTLNANQVNSFCEDGTGTLWIVTNSTLNKFDRVKQKCIRWSGKEGFPDTFSLIGDAHGNLWMSTGSGAVKYDPLTKKLTKYNDIKLGWGYRVSNGELYFVSTTFFSYKQCIMRFDPDNILNNNFIPPIVITSFKKFEKPYPLGKTIDLDYTENFLSFEFSALSYINSAKNQYAYKMEGVDKDWVNSGSRRFASYPNLDAGEYIFRVKGSNSDGVWNEEGTSIAIIISPPWWKTWWAYTSYAGLFIFALYGIRRYELNRASLKNQVKTERAVLKEREETDKMKSRFFANISHEFRTPLTLILGPAEKIISKTSDDIIKDANIIKRNSRRLLQLINQLLDLSRLEAGKLKLEASKGNIVSFVKGVALSFESLAESKDITLKLLPEKDLIELYFDREKMMKILTNILSNAFKFTAEEGKITVSIKTNPPSFPPLLKGELKGGSVLIKIRDTGIGIAQEEIPKLFDRFYQVDSSFTKEHEGTGIGLALTKELVELHHGIIKVDSKEVNSENGGTGFTEFIVELPLGRDHLKDEEIIEERTDVILNPDAVGMKNLAKRIEKTDSSSHFDRLSVTNDNHNTEVEDLNKTIILVVEDNYDMRQYIRESLDGDYLIEEAVNGEQGVRKAEKIIPDLIISDMMMPKMDGNELVRVLKNNEKTSHIPIILLTARSGQESKIEGLETGADDYLTKPFDLKELQARIENLIKIRKKLQEKFSKFEIHPPIAEDKKLSSYDEKFMYKVIEVIDKHISEEDFSIEELGNEVGMSRAQFHRKFKAITGKPASMFLRSVRLARGKKMIEEQRGNISEIAYSVGFASPSYFSKCFRDEFGYPPSDLVS